jgi:DNA-directed RNA polymerase subunit RPC12/RpoP
MATAAAPHPEIAGPRPGLFALVAGALARRRATPKCLKCGAPLAPVLALPSDHPAIADHADIPELYCPRCSRRTLRGAVSGFYADVRPKGIG